MTHSIRLAPSLKLRRPRKAKVIIARSMLRPCSMLLAVCYICAMSIDQNTFHSSICQGIPATLPEFNGRDASIQHAPVRNILYLTKEERRLALANALRYFPKSMHEKLAAEFA